MRSLPKEIVLWLDDVQVPVKVEKESIIFQHKSQSNQGWEKMAGSPASSFLSSDDGGEDEDQTFEESCCDRVAETEVEDVGVSSSNSNMTPYLSPPPSTAL